MFLSIFNSWGYFYVSLSKCEEMSKNFIVYAFLNAENYMIANFVSLYWKCSLIIIIFWTQDGDAVFYMEFTLYGNYQYIENAISVL